MFWANRKQANSLARKIDTGDALDPNVSFVQFFKNAAPAVVDDFDATYEKIFRRLIVSPSSDGGKRSKGIESLRWRIAAITGLTAILLAAGLAYSVSSRPGQSTHSIIKQSLAAVESPGKVVYYEIRHTEENGNQSKEEYWFDYDQRISKYSFTELGEERDHTIVSITQDDKTVSIERVDGKTAVTKSNKSLSDGFITEISRYRKLLQTGEVTVLGEETIKGTLTLKLRLHSSQPDKVIQTVNIRKSDYLPVRIANTYGAEVSTLELTTVRQISAATLGPKFFSIDTRPEAGERISRNLTVEEAQHFSEFDLYYLGQSFEGYTLVSIERNKDPENMAPKTNEHGPQEPPYIAQNEVRIYYQAPAGAVEFGLAVRPSNHPDAAKPSALGRRTTSTIVAVNDKQATLFQTEFPLETVYQLFVPFGNSTLEIESGDKQLALRAAASLQKLNQPNKR